MKKFILKCTISGLFFFIVLFVVEFLIPHIFSNHYKFKYDYVNEHINDISILLMGNSYFENSINPYFFGDSVFDMAISGRWIYYDKELMKRFVPRMHNLKIVLYPMGYKMPFWNSHHFPEGQEPYDDYAHEKFMHVWYDCFPDNAIRWFTISQGRQGISLFERYTSEIGYHPFTGNQPGWQNSNNISPDIIDADNAMVQVDEYTRYLTEMAEICEKYNVRFIVVTPPCYDSFIVNTRQRGIDIMHNIIEDVRNKYPIEYIDYLKDDEFRADSLYYNCSHLNSIGADLFALRVKRDFGL